ncbi:hypothetical protein VTJ83DRAFT_6252 [Remersonia thermophila]|uniref:Sfi1 spindle body domain-containing protein n=1 Tax=Remersonia thermophila TaxID=72144 RepID=A0ABR4D4C2_9PEZI
MEHPFSRPGPDGLRYMDGPHEAYSDTDIALVHQIVTLAETLLPNLPERDRLPTTALFLAAEVIFRERGVDDPDEIPSHIARLIFKIGGVRSEGTLTEKFFSVLEALGIQLELVASDTVTIPDTDAAGFSTLDQSPDATEQYDVLEAKLQRLQEQENRDLAHDILGIWCANARQARKSNRELWSFAVEYDYEDLLGAALEIWQEEAAEAEQRKLEAEAAFEHEKWVARMEKRATRVYEIFTTRTALDHWRELALEERERTAVARRHLMRKRAFESWHAQHLDDEMKVENFVLSNVLKKWGEAALHHEVRHEVASRWRDQQLCKDSVNTLWEEYNNRIADEVYAADLVTGCLRMWTHKAHETRDEYQVAVALDERLRLDEAVKTWLDGLDALRFDAYECTRQWLILGCRRDLEHWQEQARLSGILREHNAKQNREIIQHVFRLWQNALREAEDEAAVADAFMVMEPIEHWEREMRLKLFAERDERDTKAAVLKHWALEEKLAWFRRYDAKMLKQKTLETLFTAARQARSERERLEQEAADADAYYMHGDVVDAWLDGVDQMRKHRYNANLINLYRTTRPCIDHWREQTHLSRARSSYFKRSADKHSSRAIVNHVLATWPDIAEQRRRERMMTNLRQFRRQYKVDLAQDCLGRWLNATADALDAKEDAQHTNLHYKREDLHECLDLWNRAAKKAQVVEQVAADAELEAYCGRWQEQLQEAKENMQYAVEYEADKVRRRCWEKWEFETLQTGGKRHMADALHDKNERRVRRRILSEWHQRAVPGAPDSLLNPRLSTLSARRSVRQSVRPSIREQLSRSSTAAAASESGFYTASQLAVFRPRDPGLASPTTASLAHRSRELGTSPYRPDSGFASSTTTTTTAPLLGPMPEFDEDPLVPDPDDPGFMSTPTKIRGSTRNTPARRLTSTPSAILPSPYERELRRQYGGVGLLRQSRAGFSDINEESGEDLYH